MTEGSKQKDMNSILGILAIFLSIIAIALAWVAFNRSGTNLTTEIAQETREFGEDAEILAARAQARTRITALNIAEETEETWNETADEVAEIRQDLETAYEGASEEAEEEWNDLDTELEQLEGELREGSADAIQTSQNVLERLQRDIAEDEEPNPAD